MVSMRMRTWEGDDACSVHFWEGWVGFVGFVGVVAPPPRSSAIVPPLRSQGRQPAETKGLWKIHFWKIYFGKIHFWKVHFRKKDFRKIHLRKIHFQKIQPPNQGHQLAETKGLQASVQPFLEVDVYVSPSHNLFCVPVLFQSPCVPLWGLMSHVSECRDFAERKNSVYGSASFHQARNKLTSHKLPSWPNDMTGQMKGRATSTAKNVLACFVRHWEEEGEHEKGPHDSLSWALTSFLLLSAFNTHSGLSCCSHRRLKINQSRFGNWGRQKDDQNCSVPRKGKYSAS